MKKQLTQSLRIFAILVLITGVAYPLVVTLFAQLVFFDKANGSLIYQNGKVVGSRLVGQSFTDQSYFWGRPSSGGYNPTLSGGSNLGPTSAKLDSLVRTRRGEFIRANGLESSATVPSEMLCASGSGLDPHISLESALLQLNRVAKARSLETSDRERLLHLIYKLSRPADLAVGKLRYVNVLELNLEINRMR